MARIPLNPRLTPAQTTELRQLQTTLSHLKDVEAQAVIGQGIARDRIEAILDTAGREQVQP